MEKIKAQIMLNPHNYDYLSRYSIENGHKNFSGAVNNIIEAYQRLLNVTRLLEKQAHESEVWKQRANDRIKEQIVESSKKIDAEDVDNVIENYKKAVVIKEI